MQVINPATEEIIADLKEDNASSVAQKLATLKDGQKKWSAVSLKERVIVLQKFSTLLKENIEELARVLTSEVGKPLQQSRNEVNGACARIVRKSFMSHWVLCVIFLLGITLIW
jgi:acyl-CoA reductase-like NAD-dependent aldehyde dehydrogenase